jgi:type IV pilus assembly protein PilY1
MFSVSKFGNSPAFLATLAAFISAMPLQSSQAAPGVLPTAPLFLGTGVEPNLFFTLDNSGSMTLDTTMRQSRIGGLVIDVNGQVNWSPGELRRRSHDIRDLYQDRVYKLFPPANADGPPEWADYWIPRTVDANPMYYDPTKTYLPWPGTNADGSPMYLDADPTSVKADPTSGTRWDLTVTHTYQSGEMGPCRTNCKGKNPPDEPLEAEIYFPTYFNWTDTDNNGVVDVTDEYERVEIAPGTPEMQNFANWYQYHRNRYQTARFVAGTTINNAGPVRMGINMLNPDRNTGIPYWEDVASMQDPANKRKLLQTLYTAKTVGGTPALSAMLRSSEYFARTDGTGPILPAAQGGACQQNFNILMTDGAWDDESPGVGNADGDDNTEFDGGAYADAWADTLGDIAMKFYENDLRPDLPDRVPTQAGVDEADHQHLVNYTVSFATWGSLNPETDDPTAADFRGWPNPRGPSKTANISLRVDDTWHAAYNSRGRYYTADGAAALSESFNDIINNVTSRTASVAAVTVNTTELKANSFVYLPEFSSADWHGDLLAYKIVDLDSGQLAAEPAWRAGELLTRRTANGRTEDREIITYDPVLGKSVPFTWSEIPDVLKQDLSTNDLGNPDANGEARLDYLRGDRSNENSPLGFRKRSSLLGDIVNSGPIYVGAPNLGWPDVAPFPEGANAYSTFKTAMASREPAIFVGANDGMLHGFRANDASPLATDNGEEFFAYVPSMLASSARDAGLHYLTQPDYQHRFQVDLTPTVSDAFISQGGIGSAKWRTVVIGALRGGGRGLFALDVTTDQNLLEANAERTALWEFSGANDPDLGYSYSQPVVALTNAGTWVVIFGNGYNNSGDGKPHLFILDLDKGGDGQWVLGDDYIKIQAGEGSPADGNGLASPALVDVDGNGTVDRVYAGDLRGALWAFDLSSDKQGDWRVAHTSGGSPSPLFVTEANSLQPLTSKPVVTPHPSKPDSGANAPNLMVYFGTGQFLVKGDQGTTDVQRFYGIWDKGDPAVPHDKLVQQSFDGNFVDDNVLTRNPVDYDTRYGWYFDLPESGERVVTSALARGDVIFFNSYVPIAEPCVTESYGYRYAVDMATGGAPMQSAFDVNGDNQVDDADNAKSAFGAVSTVSSIRQNGYLPEPVVVSDLLYTSDKAIKIQSLDDLPTGRLSWQEIIQ